MPQRLFRLRPAGWLAGLLLLISSSAWAQAPANDNPAGAIAIPVTTDCTTPTQGTNVNATTTSVTGLGYTNSGCGIASSPKDVWYRFTTTATGPTARAVQINITGNPAGQVRVFSTMTGATGPFTEIGCSAGTAVNTVAPGFFVNGLTPSTTYYVFVSGYGSNDTTGPFTLCVTDPPGCLPVTGLTVSGITTTAANVSFVPGNGNTSYTVTYTPAGGMAQTATGTTSPIALTGLTAGTTYAVSVQPTCSMGTAAATTSSFVTACLPFTAPYSNSFDAVTAPALPACFSSLIVGGGTSALVATVSSTLANSSPNYLRIYPNSTSGQAILVSPELSDLGGGNARQTTFFARSSTGTAANIATLQVGVLTNPADATTFVAVGTPIVPTDDFRQYRVSLTGYTGTGKYLGFRVTSPNTGSSIYLDNFVYQVTPACDVPIILGATGTTTTGSVSFAPGNGNTSFTVTATPAMGPAITGTGTTSPVTLTGLTATTTYSVTVTGNCAGGATSVSTAASFTTPVVDNDEPIGAFTIPVTATCTTPTQGTNVGATTTTPNGYANAGCGAAASPKDVWYKFTTAATGPTATAVLIRVTGNPAGQVRVFSTANGAAGPFTEVGCSAGSTNDVVAPDFVVSGLTAATTYYVFVSGYGSADTQGAFTLCVTGRPASLSGAYTINNTQATAGTNFASFGDAAVALNFGGLGGAVTFAVSNGPYTEQLILNEVAGSSATNTITFNGNGRTIKFAPTASGQRGVVILNGTDFVTLDGLVVDATDNGAGSTYGFGIQLYNNADNNVIRNNTVTTNTASSSSNYVGISVSASATSGKGSGSGANQNVTVEGNTVTGGDSGITLIGNSSTSPTAGLIARNNTVNGFYNEGIYTLNTTGVRIIGNDIARPVRSGTVSTFYGIYLAGGVRSAAVERNRIHQAFAASTSSSTTYGIYVATGTSATATTTNDFVNNLIYDLDGNGTVYGIYNTSSAFARYYHNTINVDDQTNTNSRITRGFYNSNASGVEFINNIIQITRTGTGDKQALYFTTTAVAAGTTTNYNDLTGTGADFVVARINSPSNDYATLAAWQANTLAPGKDANSVSVAPGFASINNLTPSNAALDGTGTTLTRVPADFNQVTRTSPPDMGALEFMIVTTDLTASALVSPTATQSCYGAAEPVVVRVRSLGTAPLNFATNAGTVTVVVTLPNGMTRTLTGTVSTGTLAINATQDVTLNGTLDMSAVGTYSFAITATVAGDQNTTNDLLTPTTTRTKVAPTAGVLSPAATTVCTGSTATLALAGSANGSIQLQSGTSATGPFTDVTTGTGGTTASYTTAGLTQTTYFRAVTTCGTLTATSNVSTVTVNNPQPVSTNGPLAVCAGGTGTLTVTGSAGQTFQFFDAATGGTALTSTTGGTAAAPTASLTTPALTANTTYYVETTSDNSETAGLAMPNFSGTLTANSGLYFDVLASTVLKTVTVYSVGASGTVTIELRDANDVVLNTGSGTLAAGTTAAPVASVITLNFPLAVGTGYKLLQTSGLALVRDSNSPPVIYPINSSNGSVSITQSFASASYYYYFYNWQLGSTCTGTRTALQVNVTPAPTFTTTQTNACFGGTGGITVTATGGSGTFEYSSDGGTTYQASNTFSGLAAGTYAIQVRNTGGAQCAAAAQSVTITAPATATSVTATKTDATATGATDGTIVATGANGTGPYQYSIDGGTTYLPATATAAPYTFTGLAAGAYTVTVRDANGCTGTTTITVGTAAPAPCNAPTALTASAITGTTATVSFTGSASATGYTVTTTPATTTQTLAATATSVSLTGLTAGTAYTVSIVSNCAGGATSSAATVTLTTSTPAPANDEPCAAVALTNATAATATTVGATMSMQPGLAASLPTCAGNATPRDVWFTATVTGTGNNGLRLNLTGTSASTVRVFTSPSCSAGPFVQVNCQASVGAGQSVGTVTVPGLTLGTTYYIAVSSYNSTAAQGAIGITATSVIVTGTRTASNTDLQVYPNPSNTGQLTLRLAHTGQGTATLLNALGQVVQQQPLTNASEQVLGTHGLATGLYTLLVRVDGEVLTRKVVLE